MGLLSYLISFVACAQSRTWRVEYLQKYFDGEVSILLREVFHVIKLRLLKNHKSNLLPYDTPLFIPFS